jgi:hypothetical protein
MAELSKKALRVKLGVSGVRIDADELLVRELDHDFGTPAHAALAIDRKAGTFTSFNCYGDKGDVRLGRNYDAEGMTHPLPADGDEKWKKWNKKGYALVGSKDQGSEQFGFTNVENFDVVAVRKVEPAKPAKAKTPALAPKS